jgi:hypothetical protein
VVSPIDHEPPVLHQEKIGPHMDPGQSLVKMMTHLNFLLIVSLVVVVGPNTSSMKMISCSMVFLSSICTRMTNVVIYWNMKNMFKQMRTDFHYLDIEEEVRFDEYLPQPTKLNI